MVPLLFLLYIDSIKFVLSENNKYEIYADDMKIYLNTSPESKRQALENFYILPQSLDFCLSIKKCTVIQRVLISKNTKYLVYYNITIILKIYLSNYHNC